MSNESSQVITSLVNGFLQEVVNSKLAFSDILINADEPVRLRNANGWSNSEFQQYSKRDIDDILTLMEPNWEALLPLGGFSRPYPIDPWLLRITVGLAGRGQKKTLAIRRTPMIPIPFAETGLPPSILLLTHKPRGIIILSGATGAGKTTTMAAIVDHINATRTAHILTIEDPIEYEYIPNHSIFTQLEVGVDIPSFTEGVRGAMRKRPDVIVIGEVRDRETAEEVFRAGESGHLVIATLHANSASGAVRKLAQFFPGEEANKLAALGSLLMGVVHQVLVPAIDNPTGIVATELLFNHNQQFSSFLADQTKVNAALEASDDKVSRSITTSLIEHLKAKRITKADALNSVAGQGLAFKQLSDRINSGGF